MLKYKIMYYRYIWPFDIHTYNNVIIISSGMKGAKITVILIIINLIQCTLYIDLCLFLAHIWPYCYKI